jgi:hypothetical protein
MKKLLYLLRCFFTLSSAQTYSSNTTIVDDEWYNYSNTLIEKGEKERRKNYGKMFENTRNLHCELKVRIVQGNVVIDKKLVLFGNKFLDATAIYHIENSQIQNVSFIR